MFLRFIRSILGVKASTSNIATYGECGRFPPSTLCDKNVLCFYNRLLNMDDSSVAKQVFLSLRELHDMGFTTWVTQVGELAQSYGIQNLSRNHTEFKLYCKNMVKQKFEENWRKELVNQNANPKLRTYTLIKTTLVTEPYLSLVKEDRYRKAITKLRTSSHTLEIERGDIRNQRLLLAIDFVTHVARWRMKYIS